ncbi:MAG TPA: hypothetical protein VE439_04535 [Anaerolineae bacterium]|jgi:hypothetical protein|nr:hypothetical protein [Anaerolineae bacterium]
MYDISENAYTREHMLAHLRAGLTPLEAAKRKLETILSGGEDFPANSCACCETYFDREHPKACLNICPLGSTKGCCHDSYSTWIKHQNEEHMHEYVFYAIRCPECEDIALTFSALLKRSSQRRSNMFVS